jgi:hypothetical protein
MNAKLTKVLFMMTQSGQSEGAGVAEILRAIAENGGELEKPGHLVTCALEIIGWAQFFIDQVKGWPSEPARQYLVIGEDPEACLRCLFEKMSEQILHGGPVVLTDVGSATWLLSVSSDVRDMERDVVWAKEQHGDEISNLPLLWARLDGEGEFNEFPSAHTAIEYAQQAIVEEKQNVLPDHGSEQPNKMQTMIAAAEILGKNAFKNGVAAAPALDGEIMKMVAELSTPDFSNSRVIANILQAWLRGWHNANICAAA